MRSTERRGILIRGWGHSYLAQARWHHFRFQLGSRDGIHRDRRMVMIAPTLDDDGRELIPRREIQCDTLVIAVGGHTNDFGTPGAPSRESSPIEG